VISLPKRKRPDPKVYRVYTYRGHNYVKLGSLAWQVYGNFNRSKASARKRLEWVKWAFGDRKPSARFRVVKTNFGWAVVQTSPIKQYQTSSKVLKTPR